MASSLAAGRRHSGPRWHACRPRALKGAAAAGSPYASVQADAPPLGSVETNNSPASSEARHSDTDAHETSNSGQDEMLANENAGPEAVGLLGFHQTTSPASYSLPGQPCHRSPTLTGHAATHSESDGHDSECKSGPPFPSLGIPTARAARRVAGAEHSTPVINSHAERHRCAREARQPRVTTQLASVLAALRTSARVDPLGPPHARGRIARDGHVPATVSSETQPRRGTRDGEPLIRVSRPRDPPRAGASRRIGRADRVPGAVNSYTQRHRRARDRPR